MIPKFGKVLRQAWDSFPTVWLHASEAAVKGHEDYMAAKSGNSDAAFRLVDGLGSYQVVDQLKAHFRVPAVLVSAHAIERNGLNAIPEALAEFLSEQLDWPVDHDVVQSNIVGHTGADGFARLARQAQIERGTPYFLVDDFVGQGGTLANLRSFIGQNGGVVLGATTLTGKRYSTKLPPAGDLLKQLRTKHGHSLEEWWLDTFGFGYECLTHSEAYYLLNTPNADRIRNRIAEAVQT